MTAFAPKRRFSQNFLTDVGIARAIVSSLALTSEDVVAEIGPGKGALTTHLAESAADQVVSIEVDSRAVKFLKQQSWVANGRVSVLEADALTIEIGRLFPRHKREHRCVIGNIPYAITSPLLFWMFEQRADIGRGVMMMQREVARRCVASVGSKDYGILSVACWLHGSARLLFHVQPGSFFPRPSVTSSVVRFDLSAQTSLGLPQGPFMDFVRSAFSQRRKVMTNALADWAHRFGIPLKVDHVHVGMDLSRRRAEECSPELLGQIYLSLTGRHAIESSDFGIQE